MALAVAAEEAGSVMVEPIVMGLLIEDTGIFCTGVPQEL